MGQVNQRIVMPAPITLERVRTQNIVTSERKIRWEKSCSGNSTQRKFGFYVGRVVNQIRGVANG
jgi:hypothetical protein